MTLKCFQLLLREQSTKNVILTSKIEELNHKLETEKGNAQFEILQHEKKNLLYAIFEY